VHSISVIVGLFFSKIHFPLAQRNNVLFLFQKVTDEVGQGIRVKVVVGLEKGGMMTDMMTGKYC